jgi:uncharacterized protein (UPF0335 family)
MARKPKINQPKAGTNGFDPDVLNSIVSRIESVFDDLLSERGVYMHKCKSLREDIANLYDEAKARGIPPKSLKKAVKARELNRKIDALRADLDMVDQESYDQIRFALGDLADTPLGAAALKDAPDAPKTAPDEPDIRPAFMRGEYAGEPLKPLTEAGAAVAAGIKELKPKKSKLGGAEADGSYKLTN